MLIRNMPGFSTYSTHKQKKNSRGTEKVEILIPTLEEYFLGKIGATFSCSPECCKLQILFRISISEHLVPY